MGSTELKEACKHYIVEWSSYLASSSKRNVNKRMQSEYCTGWAGAMIADAWR